MGNVVVPINGGCMRHSDCISGWCLGASRANCGVCQPKAAEGEQCNGKTTNVFPVIVTVALVGPT